MKRLIGWALVSLGGFLLVDQVWALNLFGFEQFGFWFGLLNFTILPVTYILFPLLRLFVSGETGDLFYFSFILLLIFIGSKFLVTKSDRIPKLSAPTLDEKKLPQPNSFDKFKSFLAVPFSYYFILFSSGLTISIAVLLIGGIYYLESSFSNTIHTGILFLLGLGALIGVGSGLYAMVQGLIKKGRVEIAFKLKHEGSKIFQMIDEVSSKLGTTPPENILISFAPDFHVHQVKSTLLTGEKIGGRTLTVGVSFLRYLNEQEFKAILTHEMSHFTGGDTLLSVYVYPTYKSMKVLIDNLSGLFTTTKDKDGNESSPGWTAIPNLLSFWIINKFYEAFSKLMARIDRVREARADMIASSVYGSNAFSDALTKVAKYQHVLNSVYFEDYWNLYTKENKVFTNYFEFFDKSYLTDKDVRKIMDNVVASDKTTGDFDSHTSIQGRLAYIPHNEMKISKKTILNESELKDYEEQLSELYGNFISIVAGSYKGQSESDTSTESEDKI